MGGFTGSSDKAAIAGDVAMLESEVTPVLEALRKSGHGTGRDTGGRFQGRGERARQTRRRRASMIRRGDQDVLIRPVRS